MPGGIAEPVTSSVSDQGSYLAGSHDLAMGGSGGEPRRVVARCRCCHFCCHRPSSCRWVMSTTPHVSCVSGVRRVSLTRESRPLTVAYVWGGLPVPQRLVSKFVSRRAPQPAGCSSSYTWAGHRPDHLLAWGSASRAFPLPSRRWAVAGGRGVLAPRVERCRRAGLAGATCQNRCRCRWDSDGGESAGPGTADPAGVGTALTVAPTWLSTCQALSRSRS
jgi:hypothetical protein